jgi:hypothetical protein
MWYLSDRSLGLDKLAGTETRLVILIIKIPLNSFMSFFIFVPSTLRYVKDKGKYVAEVPCQPQSLRSCKAPRLAEPQLA